MHLQSNVDLGTYHNWIGDVSDDFATKGLQFVLLTANYASPIHAVMGREGGQGSARPNSKTGRRKVATDSTPSSQAGRPQFSPHGVMVMRAINFVYEYRRGEALLAFNRDLPERLKSPGR